MPNPIQERRDPSQAWADLTSSTYAARTPPAVQQAAASVFRAVLAAAMADMASGALEVGGFSTSAGWQRLRTKSVQQAAGQAFQQDVTSCLAP